MFRSSDYIERNYVFPTKDNIHFPEKKKNLIHIYLESMESTYFDKGNGGYMDENLMPNLLELSKEGIHFSNKNTMGGPFQITGTTFTIAAMVAMTSGVPLKMNITSESYKEFLPGITNIGDILDNNGYNQFYLSGSDSLPGGFNTYYSSHGHYRHMQLNMAIYPKAIKNGGDLKMLNYLNLLKLN